MDLFAATGGALTEAMDDGHCGLPTDELLSLAERLLEVPVELVRTALDLELADGTVVADSVGGLPAPPGDGCSQKTAATAGGGGAWAGPRAAIPAPGKPAGFAWFQDTIGRVVRDCRWAGARIKDATARVGGRNLGGLAPCGAGAAGGRVRHVGALRTAFRGFLPARSPLTGRMTSAAASVFESNRGHGSLRTCSLR
jgi:hypothetical protein